MRVLAGKTIVAAVLAVFALCNVPASAADAPLPAAPAASTMDPALKRALSGVATVLLADFARSMASGSADGFDPGPTVERAVGGLLASGQLDRLIDGLMGQALGASGGPAGDLPPELRAALALAAKAMIANVRREVGREFSAQ